MLHRRGGIVKGERHGQGTVFLCNFICDFLGGGLQAQLRAATHTARLWSGQEACVGAGPESHGRGVNGFVGVGVR